MKLTLPEVLYKMTNEYSREFGALCQYKFTGTRVWTRGDGVRSRDPARIIFSTEKECSDYWNYLQKNDNSKLIGYVSGEFGRSSYDPAASYLGFVIVKRSYNIEVMSRSRINNKNSVWRFKEKLDI